MILNGLERMLFNRSDEWDMSFVESGEAALMLLEQRRFDVIVTDMRMPEMDGAALLNIVRSRFSDVIRIVLSGHAELEAALRAVPVAHQYLAKPCDAELLVRVVHRAINLRALLDDDAVRNIVGTIDSLPSVPRIYTELTKALANEETNAVDIAGIISQDIAMTAKVLQIVNSAFFNQAARISSIEDAVVRLGFKMVKNLALAVEVFDRSVSAPIARGFSIETAQNHAFRTAMLTETLINDKSVSDDAFMAAMLHDVGKLILAQKLPDQFEAALALAIKEDVPLYRAEERLLGVCHAEIGGYLLGIWGLPYSIVEAVSNHHEPMRVTEQREFGVLAAVYVANCLANNVEMNTDYLEELGVQNQVDTWWEMAAEHDAA